MKIVLCNTGTSGCSHARFEDESNYTLCGRHAYIPNADEDKHPLSEVECKKCKKIIRLAENRGVAYYMNRRV